MMGDEWQTCDRCRVMFRGFHPCPVHYGMLLSCAVGSLVDILRVIVPLAAAAQAGRCSCGALIPWHRMGWNRPTCESVAHHGEWVERLESDVRRRDFLELKAEEISLVIGPRGWSER